MPKQHRLILRVRVTRSLRLTICSLIIRRRTTPLLNKFLANKKRHSRTWSGGKWLKMISRRPSWSKWRTNTKCYLNIRSKKVNWWQDNIWEALANGGSTSSTPPSQKKINGWLYQEARQSSKANLMVYRTLGTKSTSVRGSLLVERKTSVFLLRNYKARME